MESEINIKLASSLIIIFGLYALLFWLSTKVKKEAVDVPINLSLLVLGAAIGWIAGIFLTPYPGQESDFANYASLVSLFVSGYLVGKVDASISHLFKPATLFQPMVGFRVVLTFSAFLLALVVTTAIRIYMTNGA